MCNANTRDDVTVLCCSEKNCTETNARIIGDADGPEEAENKVDIIMSDKTNKTPILVSY